MSVAGCRGVHATPQSTHADAQRTQSGAQSAHANAQTMHTIFNLSRTYTKNRGMRGLVAETRAAAGVLMVNCRQGRP